MGCVDSRAFASVWFRAWSSFRSARESSVPPRGREAVAAAVRPVLERLESRQLLAGTPVISEFMAVNNSTIRDKDLEYSDWIELHNPGATDVNLDGYRLTDSSSLANSWRLPAVTLPAGGYLLVFASGKDLSTAGQELHTDFALDAAGEYLALLAPDGTTVLSEYDPYPTQLADISYGIGVDSLVTGLVSPGGPGRYHVPTSGTLGADWRQRTFDDAAWKVGPMGIGFEGPGGLPEEIEPNNGTAAANDAATGFLPVDGSLYQMTLRGSFGSSADWFNIGTLTAGDVVTITVSAAAGARGTLPNPALELWRGNAAAPVLVATDSDGGPGQDALIYRLTITADDTYYLHSINPGGAVGQETYELGVMLENVGAAPATTGSAVNEAEQNNNAAQATNLSSSWRRFAYQAQTQGQISSASDADVFRYQFAAGDRVSFTLAATSPLDAKISLLNAAGQVIATEDGSSALPAGASGDSAIYSYLIGASDAYYVRVESSNGSTGAYALTAHLSAAAAPPPNNPYAPHIGTNVKADMGDRTGAYLRLPFAIDEIDFDTLRLRVRYDDGFVAYVNGQEVARRNAPVALDWNSSASGTRANAQAVLEEIINIPLDALVAGAENVLAIHGLNHASDKSDFLLAATLEGLETLTSVPRYFQPATPRSPNNPSGTVGVVADTTFSKDRGFYDAPITVAIASETPGAQVRYTTDGSEPTVTTGVVYTGPITVSTTTILRAAAFKPGHIPSNIDTQTYLFVNDIIRQPHNPTGFPQVGEPGVHWDYGMDQRVVNDPVYSGRIVDALKAIPSMSLVMEHDDLFGSTGIYQNPGGSGLNWEKPGSAELIYADGTKDGFQIDAGVRIYGGVSRATWYPKHTFRLLFKKQYGAGKLDFPLFQDGIMGDSAVEEFDTVILRGNFNKTWTFTNSGERTNAQYIHDSFISDLQLAMGQPGIHSTFVHLYVNGHYWGLYNPVERPDAAFAAAYMGGEKEEWDALNSSEPVDGVKTAWTAMQNIANGIVAGQAWTADNPNPNALATPEAYAAIKEYLDVENLVDYFILNIWGGNIDWDDHNWYAARKREPGAGYKFFSWDAERTLESTTYDKTEVGGTFGQRDKPSRLYKQLRANPEFRLLFADRVHKHMFNGGLLTPEVAKARYMELAAVVDEAIIGESARWGDYQRPAQPYTRDAEWITEQNRLMNVYFPVRTNNVLNQFRADGLYPAVAAPSFNQHGGEVAEGFSLTMSAPAGTIYYTLDGSDPRLPGGVVAPGARVYNSAVTLDATTIAKARVLSNGVWSAVNQATFAVDTSALRVSEIMYNPAPPPAGSPYVADDFEFIELVNTSNRPLGLLGVTLPDINFTFGNVTLAAGARTVLVKNQAAFQSRYPGVAVGGVYTGSLDNAGEHIQLTNARGRVVLDFEYDDNWYDHTDGGGYSLVAIDPAAPPPQYGLKSNWRPSNVPLGGPGAPDPGINPGAVVINEVMTHAQGTDHDWIELHNTTNAPIDVGGWFLSDSALDLTKYQIAAGTTIPAKGYLVLYADQHFGVAGNPGVTAPFTLSELGGSVRLTNANGAATDVAGYREAVSFGAADRGVSFGRHSKSTGGVDFPAQNGPTPGAVNSSPRTGPVVINELMYNPAGSNIEYVELRNVSNAAVPLYDPQNPSNTWKFTNGITFTFPAGVSLPASGSLLVVPIDPAMFRTRYNIHPNIPIFGPYSGALDNAGEQVELAKPGEPQPDGTVRYISVDRVNYEQAAPWPSGASGTGAALSRKNSTTYANDAANWQAEPAGSPGFDNFDTTAPVADIIDVSPDPRVVPVDSVRITFSELITDLDLGDFSLDRAGGPLSLANASLTTTDGYTYTLGNLASLTSEPGTYTLLLHISTIGVRDLAGNDLVTETTESFTVAAQSNQLTGTPGDDHFYAKRVGTDLHVWPNADGSGPATSTIPLPMSSAFSASLGDGNDTITFDMSGGDIDLLGGLELLSANGDDRIRLVNGNGRTLTLGALTLNGKTLDLGTADLRVFDGDLAALSQLVRSARTGDPRWSGPGITTTAAVPNAGLAVFPVGFDDVLIKYTYDGDANADGRINSDDYFRIDSGFLAQSPLPTYAQGDFNYDGIVNSDDYFLIDSAFLGQGAPLASTPLTVSPDSSPLFSTTAIANPAQTPTQPDRRAPVSTSLLDSTTRRKVRRVTRR